VWVSKFRFIESSHLSFGFLSSRNSDKPYVVGARLFSIDHRAWVFLTQWEDKYPWLDRHAERYREINQQWTLTRHIFLFHSFTYLRFYFIFIIFLALHCRWIFICFSNLSFCFFHCFSNFILFFLLMFINLFNLPRLKLITLS